MNIFILLTSPLEELIKVFLMVNVFNRKNFFTGFISGVLFGILEMLIIISQGNFVPVRIAIMIGHGIATGFVGMNWKNKKKRITTLVVVIFLHALYNIAVTLWI